MRMAYLLTDHGIPVFGDKGASVHVRELSNALCDMGHTVSILCGKRGSGSYESKFECQKVPEISATSAQVQDDDPNAARIAKESRYLQSAESMVNVFLHEHAKKRFDVMYERYSLWSKAGVTAAKKAGIPVILEVNAPLVVEQSAYRELALADEAKAIEHACFSQADVIITVSETLAQYVIDHGGHQDQVVVMPNGVNDGLFHPMVTAANVAEAEGRFVIAFSGSLKQWHGVDVLMTAFQELCRRMAGLHLLVIGDGPMSEWLQGFVAGSNLQSNVTFTGWTPHHQIPALIAAADVCVAPYPQLENFYFSPLKLFEYLAMGKPVIASDIGQIRAVIQHHENGILVPPGNERHLADALEMLCVNAPLRAQLSAAAYQSSRPYTWKQNAARVTAICQDLLQSDEPQRRVQ